MHPPWPAELHVSSGSPVRLRGVKVYHDFAWTEVFPDERRQFKNGMSLAQLARDGTPKGKRPALLLTIDDDAPERPLETDTEYVVVVRIKQYLAQAGSDPAASYYAHPVRKRLTQLSGLEEAELSPELIQAVVDHHLTAKMVETWAAALPERREALRSITGPPMESPTTISPERIAETLRAMGEVPPKVWATLAELLPGLLDDDTRRQLLDAITSDHRGRRAASAVLGDRIVDRIADTRTAISEYERLLEDDRASESALQSFIQDHPWMVGLDYISVKAKRPIPRGQLDFCLERYDGFYDILELKSPSAVVVSSDAPHEDLPPPANTFKLGPALANALAQVHVYRDALTTEEESVQRLWGLSHSRDPRLIVVVGQARHMTPECRRVLQQLNLSLHRVEVMPYDILGERAEGWLKNIEHYLANGSMAP